MSKHFEEFEVFLNSTKINFDVIAVTESTILKDKADINNLKLQNYNMEFCPTSSNAGGQSFISMKNILINQELIYQYIKKKN